MKSGIIKFILISGCVFSLSSVVWAQDSWEGGTGNWSSSNWSTGAPPATGQNTVINTGSDDVTLDVSAEVGNLTLGGSTGNSQLSNSGQTLTIDGALTVGVSGGLYLNNGLVQIKGTGTSTVAGSVGISNNSLLSFAGNLTNSGTITTNYGNNPSSINPNVFSVAGTFTNNGLLTVGAFDDTNLNNGRGGDGATFGTLVNNGTINVGNGATLTVSNGISDVASGSDLVVNGTVNGLSSLATVEGTLQFGNQQTNSISSLTNSGSVYVGDCGTGTNCSGTVLSATGNVTNSNYIQVEKGGTLTVGGTYTGQSNAFLEVGAFGAASANVNALNLGGTVQIDQGSTLNITGGTGVTNIASGATLIQNGTFTVSGGTNALAGLTTVAGVLELGNQQTTTIGSLTNSGQVYVGDCGTGSNCSGTVLSATGNVTNSNYIQVEKGGTLNVGGTFTNNANSTLEVGAYGTASANVNALSLAGTVQIDQGSSMTITGGTGITNIASNAALIQNGTFTVSGGTNALAGLTSVAGVLELGNQQTTTIASLTNSGQVYVGDCGTGTNCSGTTLTATGNVTNGNYMQLEYGGTLNVGGTFTNQAGATIEIGAYGSANANLNALSLAGTMQIDGGSTVNLTGGMGVTDIASNATLIQNGTFTVGGGTNALATLTSVEGTLELGNAQTTTVGSLTNSGTLQIADCGTGSGCNGTTLNVTGDLKNTNNVYVEYGGNLTVAGTFTNSGYYEIGPYGTASSTIATLNNGGTTQVDGGSSLTVTSLTNGGTVNVANQATLTATTIINNVNMTIGQGNGGLVSATTFTNNLGATLTLTAGSNGNAGGMLDPMTFSSGGVTNMGAGSTLIVGSGTTSSTGYTQFANGTLGEMIYGSNSSGLITVSGQATLAGTLDVLLENGYDPTIGSKFTIMDFTAGDLTGMFANIENDIFNNDTEQWMVTYDNADGDVYLTAEAYSAPPPPPPSGVPEPGTIALMGVGLLACGLYARRKHVTAAKR